MHYSIIITGDTVISMFHCIYWQSFCHDRFRLPKVTYCRPVDYVPVYDVKQECRNTEHIRFNAVYAQSCSSYLDQYPDVLQISI
jgi:hypothetical protein